MKHIEYIFEELDELEGMGITAISLVESAANKMEFVAMSEGEEVRMSALDQDKQLLIAPVLMPGMMPKAPSKGKQGKFSKDSIEKIMNNYVKSGMNSSTTIHHRDKIDGCFVTQNWIVDRNNGVMAGYGFDSGDNKVPDGTWMAAMKVENEDIWKNDVKSGEVKGFSIEGNFRSQPVEMSEKEQNNPLGNVLDELLDEIE